jgi:hypothetical protein
MSPSDTHLLDVMAKRWATKLARTSRIPVEDLYQQSALALCEAKADATIPADKVTLAAYRDVLDWVRSLRRYSRSQSLVTETDDDESPYEPASPLPSPEDICIARETWSRLSLDQQETLSDFSQPSPENQDRIYQRRCRARRSL